MEPQLGLLAVRLLPGVPRIDRLAFAVDKSPVVGSAVGFFEDLEARVKEAVVASGHVLGAYDRTVVPLERFDRPTQRGSIPIVMEGDDIGLFQTEFINRTEFRFVFPESDPHAAGQRLRWIDLTGPLKATFCE